MHAIQTLLTRPETERLGWVLLHFVWQGAMIALVSAIAFAVLRRASANLRYLLACGALLAMAACLPLTWFVVAGQAVGRLGPRHDRVTGAGGAVEASEVLSSRSAVTTVLTTEHEENNGGSPAADATDKPSRSVAASPLPVPAAVNTSLQSNPGRPTWFDRIAAALPWLVIAWLFGVFVLSIRLAIGWQAVHRLRRGTSLAADGSWQAALSQLCDRLHIRSSVKLLESGLVDVPTMIGWLRPAILWPPALLAGLSVEQFEALLRTSWPTCARHDYIVNLIQTAIETLLFYHPAVWWLSRRIRHERECCCDDLAVAACGNRLSYARALATLEEHRSPARQLALAADGGHLLTRIRRIVGLPAPRRSSGRHWLLGVILSTSLIALGLAIGLANFATGDEPAKKSPEPPFVELEVPAPPAPRAVEPPPLAPRVRLKTDPPRPPLDLEISRILDSDATELLPESLGEQIKNIPHVTAVSGVFWLLSPAGYAISADSPLMKEPKIIAGRMLAAGDRHKVIVGKLAAEKGKLKVGDKTKVNGADAEIVGIFDHPRSYWNSGTIALLPDIQQLLHADHRVSQFVVSVDISQDIADEQQSQMAELCKQIEAVGYDLKATNLANTRPSLEWSRDDGPPAPEVTLELSGRVVDDETGDVIPAFNCQIGHVYPDQVHWEGDYGYPADAPGHFRASLNWVAGERLRIIADGYVPETVLKDRPKPGEIKEIAVRMKRGPRVSGRILDYDGKPVAGASVYVVGSLHDFLITGPHWSAGAHSDGTSSSTNAAAVARFATDADGKFTVTGVGWDAKYLAISCAALDLWVVPAPSPGLQQGDFEVRLPQPGKLVVRYDIAGGANSAMVALWPLNRTLYHGGGAGTFGPSPFPIDRNDLQAHVKYWRVGGAKQGGEGTLESLPPGEYVVGRIKGFQDLRHSPMAVLDETVVKVLSGRMATVDFVRPKGATVTGQVTGLDRPEVLKTIPSHVFVAVSRANEPGAGSRRNTTCRIPSSMSSPSRRSTTSATNPTADLPPSASRPANTA